MASINPRIRLCEYRLAFLSKTPTVGKKDDLKTVCDRIDTKNNINENKSTNDESNPSNRGVDNKLYFGKDTKIKEQKMGATTMQIEENNSNINCSFGVDKELLHKLGVCILITFSQF